MKLPVAHCAFKGCSWILTRADETLDPWMGPGYRAYSYVHFASEHLRAAYAAIFQEVCGPNIPSEEYMDYYEEAIKVVARRGMPSVGLSVDRRTLQHVREVYHDDAIKTLICSLCATKQTFLWGV